MPASQHLNWGPPRISPPEFSVALPGWVVVAQFQMANDQLNGNLYIKELFGKRIFGAIFGNPRICGGPYWKVGDGPTGRSLPFLFRGWIKKNQGVNKAPKIERGLFFLGGFLQF